MSTRFQVWDMRLCLSAYRMHIRHWFSTIIRTCGFELCHPISSWYEEGIPKGPCITYCSCLALRRWGHIHDMIRDRQYVWGCTICMVACVWVCGKLMWQAYLFTKVKACSMLRYCLCASIVECMCVWGGRCRDLSFLLHPHISCDAHVNLLFQVLHWSSLPVPPLAPSGVPNPFGKKKKKKGGKQSTSWPQVTSRLWLNQKSQWFNSFHLELIDRTVNKQNKEIECSVDWSVVIY